MRIIKKVSQHYANKQMEERDADLGYIKRYVDHLHQIIESGGILTDYSDDCVKQAHTLLQNVYIENRK